MGFFSISLVQCYAVWPCESQTDTVIIIPQEVQNVTLDACEGSQEDKNARLNLSCFVLSAQLKGVP